MADYRYEDLVSDLGMEIIYGTDRFDKNDIDYVIEKNQFNRGELKQDVIEWVGKNSNGFDPEVAPLDFVEKEVDYWVEIK